VAIDLFFDHLLAKHWSRFHPKELNVFLQQFYDSVQLHGFDYTDEFQEMIGKMIEINWISYYSTLDGLNKMCHGVANRISFPTQLIKGVEVYLAHEKEIESTFFEFMSDAQDYFGNDI
jgi:acyl carrier protein phosphodiesterase